MTLNRVNDCGSLTNWKEKYKVTDVQTSEDGLSPVTDFNTPSRCERILWRKLCFNLLIGSDSLTMVIMAALLRSQDFNSNY